MASLFGAMSNKRNQKRKVKSKGGFKKKAKQPKDENRGRDRGNQKRKVKTNGGFKKKAKEPMDENRGCDRDQMSNSVKFDSFK